MVFVAQTTEMTEHMLHSNVIRTITAASNPHDSQFPRGTNLLKPSVYGVLGFHTLFQSAGCGQNV